MVARKCVALLVLAVGAASGKRTLQQAQSIVSTSGLAAVDKSISSQFDAARNAARATVPKELDHSLSSAFSAAATNLLPGDWQNKVELAIKNFKAGGSQSTDPQVKDFAKMMAGIMLLDNEGDSNIAHQKLGDLIKQLIDFTFNLAKIYATAPVKIVTELPKNLTDAIRHSQPQNFFAWFQDHKQQYEDLLGIVYRPNGTTGSLTHPDSIDISGNFFNYAPCIISNTPAGFVFGATGISITPQLLQTAPSAFNVQPQGANIQPAFFYAFPAGFNVQPQGLNVAPTLIGITPGGYTNAPAGGVVGGSLLGLSIAQDDPAAADGPAAGDPAADTAAGAGGSGSNAGVGAGAGGGAGGGGGGGGR